MTYIDDDKRRKLVKKYPSLKQKNWRKPSPEGDQIDAPMRVAEREDYSSRAQDIPRLAVVLQHMAENPGDRAWDGDADDLYLPNAAGLSVENSSLTGESELMPGVRLADLRALHNTAQAVAGNSVHIGQRVQLSAFTGLQFQVTLGWTSRTVAERLLDRRHAHRCTLCEWRDGTYRRGSCGIAVTCGTVLRVINACDECRESIEFEYSGVDVFYQAGSEHKA
ncbi:MAG: hypothetical protein WBD41_00485 [Rhodococcus sp. (in: high G+C Gram-positive bacteria)]|jgi:hypothetical protein